MKNWGFYRSMSIDDKLGDSKLVLPRRELLTRGGRILVASHPLVRAGAAALLGLSNVRCGGGGGGGGAPPGPTPRPAGGPAAPYLSTLVSGFSSTFATNPTPADIAQMDALLTDLVNDPTYGVVPSSLTTSAQYRDLVIASIYRAPNDNGTPGSNPLPFTVNHPTDPNQNKRIAVVEKSVFDATLSDYILRNEITAGQLALIGTYFTPDSGPDVNITVVQRVGSTRDTLFNILAAIAYKIPKIHSLGPNSVNNVVNQIFDGNGYLVNAPSPDAILLGAELAKELAFARWGTPKQIQQLPIAHLNPSGGRELGLGILVAHLIRHYGTTNPPNTNNDFRTYTELKGPGTSALYDPNYRLSPLEETPTNGLKVLRTNKALNGTLDLVAAGALQGNLRFQLIDD